MRFVADPGYGQLERAGRSPRPGFLRTPADSGPLPAKEAKEASSLSASRRLRSRLPRRSAGHSGLPRSKERSSWIRQEFLLRFTRIGTLEDTIRARADHEERRYACRSLVWAAILLTAAGGNRSFTASRSAEDSTQYALRDTSLVAPTLVPLKFNHSASVGILPSARPPSRFCFEPGSRAHTCSATPSCLHFPSACSHDRSPPQPLPV